MLKVSQTSLLSPYIICCNENEKLNSNFSSTCRAHVHILIILTLVNRVGVYDCMLLANLLEVIEVHIFHMIIYKSGLHGKCRDQPIATNKAKVRRLRKFLFLSSLKSYG